MRVLLIGAGGTARTETSLLRALTDLGHQAVLLDALRLRRRLGPLAPSLARWKADRFGADFVLCTRHAIALGEQVLRRLLARRTSAFWYFDPVAPLPDPVVRLARQVDRTFATYGYQVEAFRSAGATEAHFLPQGMDPAIDRPASSAPPEYHCEASFVGSGQYPRRHAVLRSLARVARLQIRGPSWQAAPRDLPVAGGTVRGAEFGRVVCGATVSLGIDALDAQRQERAGGTSNRLWRVLGAGGCYLGEAVEGVERFARQDQHAVWYRSPSEAVERLRELLGDPDRVERLRQAGRAHALAGHTYAHRLRDLLAGQGFTSM